MSLVAKNSRLSTVLGHVDPTARFYLLGILRGYSEAESREIAKGTGANIDRYLLDPVVAQLREYFLDNGWGDEAEVAGEWHKLLFGTYTEIILLRGIQEAQKPGLRDKQMVSEATKLVIANKAKGKDGGAEASYDELILKRHRKVVDKGNENVNENR